MKSISYILLAVFLNLSSISYAADFVVLNGTIETTPQALSASGEVGIIEERGAIVITGSHAVTMNTGDDQTVLNRGTISTTDTARGIFNNGGARAVITNSGKILTVGASAHGIFNSGVGATNAVITNSGRITTIGANADGIFNDGGTDAVLTNSGQISTTGNNSDGIISSGARSVLTNSGQITTRGTNARGIANIGGANVVITSSGLISTAGGGANGISNTGADVHIINSGTIRTVQPGFVIASAHGIFNSGATAVITNSGLITTGGSGAHGIFNSGGATAVITNSGLISTAGNGAHGISNTGADVHIINSGTIRVAAANAFVLNLTGIDPTLSLLRGSNLDGNVNVGATALNLNVETGLNLALTLNSGSFGSLGIDAPFVLVGSTITVIDPTGLAMQADVVADLSDTILNGIYRHRTCHCTPCGCGVWTQGIGSYRKRSDNSHTVGHDNWQGGFLVGYDTYFCGGYANLFGGISYGEAEVDERTQKATTRSYVGGVTYERLFCNNFLGLAITAGYVDWDNKRIVMNNLVPGGVETARADTGGLFVSPEVTLGHHFASLWFCPIMSFTLRYAGLFLGDYSETGSVSNLSVKNRDIELLTTRFEVALPYGDSQGRCCWSLEPYFGAFGRYQVGGNRVDSELQGLPLKFNPGSPRNLVAFLVGFRGTQSFGCFNLSLNVEGSFDNFRSSRILGEGGIGFSF